MSIRLATRRSAVVGLALTTVVAGGIAAYAYPPGSKLTVVGVPQANGDTIVTISNANPNCDFRLSVDGGTPTEDTIVHRTGSTTITVPVHVTGGRDHDVRVHAYKCTKGEDKEHARNEFVIPSSQVSGPATARTGKTYRVAVSGVQKGTVVALMAMNSDDGTTVPATDSNSDRANGRGEAKPRITLPTNGHWVVTAVAGATNLGMVNTIAS